MDVSDWLLSLGLERYTARFRENAISADLLPSLTAQDLLDLGVTAVGHRRRLLDAIAGLQRARLAPAGQQEQSAASVAGHDSSGEVKAERRYITVVFCDLVGSTLLSTRLDPEDLRQLLDNYRAIVGAAINSKRGYVARFLGDGVLAYFGWPNADEAHADSAVRAALAVVEAVRPHQLSVRIGIATGLVVVGDLIRDGVAQEFTAVGETPNLASRLQGLAAPDTVVVSAATRSLLGRLVDVQDLGPVELKGFDAPQRVWRVLRETGLVSQSEALYGGAQTPLIGREEELELLVHHWQRAASGAGRVILLTGEPGIGKSRLLTALGQHLVNEPHIGLRYFCSPHHQNSALYPIIARWEQEAGFSSADSAEVRLQKLKALSAVSALSPEDVALLAALLSIPTAGHYPQLDISPQHLREKILAMLIRLIVSRAAAKPILLTFEDAHWADSSSLQLLEMAIDQLVGLPILLIISFRSDFTAPWIGRAGVSLIALSRLDVSRSATLATHVAAARTLEPSTLERIVMKADGVPLFIEELTKHVLDLPSGHDRATLPMPETLQASLMARLDRIPAGKHIAQIAAALGRDFSYALLAAVARLPQERLAQGLDELVAAGLVFRRRVAPDEIYTFRHALICDTAYESMLRSRRIELHAAIVEALESDIAMERWPLELLGYHCAQAGRPEKAAFYYRRAASNPHSFAEVQTLLERALQADPSSVTSLTMLANVLMNRTHMFGRRIDLEEVDRAHDLIARARQISPDSVDVLSAHAYWLRAQSRFSEARQAFQHLAEIEPGKSSAQLMLGVCAVELGEIEASLLHFEAALRLDPADPDLWLTQWRMGEALGLLGHDAEAIPWLRQALATNPNNAASNLSRINLALASAHAWLGELDEARLLVSEANRLWPFHTVRGWRYYMRASRMVEKTEHVREGLRRAGLREYADEDEDFGVAADQTLSSVRIGHTPTGVPGASRIRSMDLFAMLSDNEPLMIDTLELGRSIPGAICLAYAGSGGSFTDPYQLRLDRKVRELTDGDNERPVVTLSWNAERWDGRNLALRLVALGYTNVHWYRGGREAWEMYGGQTADLPIFDW